MESHPRILCLGSDLQVRVGDPEIPSTHLWFAVRFTIFINQSTAAIISFPSFNTPSCVFKDKFSLAISIEMAEKAKQRLHAIGTQIAPAVVEDETFEDVPPIKQVGPASNGPRAQGKVVIITGKYIIFRPSITVTMATVSLKDVIISLTRNPNP